MNNNYQTGFDHQKRTKEINLKELFKVVKRYFWVILAVVLLGGAIGYIKSTASVAPLYESSSRVIIGTDDQSRTTLEVIIRDASVLDQVINKLQLKTSSDALARKISVASINSSQVVSINVVDASPTMAAQIANTTAQVFKDEVPIIVGKDYVRLLSMATINPEPINMEQTNKMPIYTIIGLVIGIGLAFLLDSLNDSIHSEKEAGKLLGTRVLGKISKINKKNVRRNKKKLEVKLRGETIVSK